MLSTATVVFSPWISHRSCVSHPGSGAIQCGGGGTLGHPLWLIPFCDFGQALSSPHLTSVYPSIKWRWGQQSPIGFLVCVDLISSRQCSWEKSCRWKNQAEWNTAGGGEVCGKMKHSQREGKETHSTTYKWKPRQGSLFWTKAKHSSLF